MAKQSNAQFAKALYQIVKDLPKEKMPEVAKEFLSVLKKNSKLKKIEYILTEFEAYAKKQSGIKTIELETVHPVENKTLEKIKQIFGKESEISQTINKEMLGGIKIKVDDTVYDASLKTQLQRLKQSLIS